MRSALPPLLRNHATPSCTRLTARTTEPVRSGATILNWMEIASPGRRTPGSVVRSPSAGNTASFANHLYESKNGGTPRLTQISGPMFLTTTGSWIAWLGRMRSRFRGEVISCSNDESGRLRLPGTGLPQAKQSTLAGGRRSEEHTSELQSPCNLVCRLL